jgi:hypothetical protein
MAGPPRLPLRTTSGWWSLAGSKATLNCIP